MSHTTTLNNVVIRDANALRSAVAELQTKGVRCELRENVKPRLYYQNQHGVCPFVLKLHESKYDVGFDRKEDGTYVPVFDDWAGQVKGQIGAACPLPGTREGNAQHTIGRLMQSYAKHAAMNAATAQGYIIEDTTTDDEGNIHLTLGNVA